MLGLWLNMPRIRAGEVMRQVRADRHTNSKSPLPIELFDGEELYEAVAERRFYQDRAKLRSNDALSKVLNQ